jgi:predicted nucleic acid-binding protein
LKEDKEVYVFDTSALLTYIEDEEGSEYVESLLIRAEKGEVIIYVAFVSLMEVFYITQRRKKTNQRQWIELS